MTAFAIFGIALNAFLCAFCVALYVIESIYDTAKSINRHRETRKRRRGVTYVHRILT